MEVVRDKSIQTFVDSAGDFLYRAEAVNNLMIGLCEMSLRQASESSSENGSKQPTVPVMVRLVSGGQTVGA
ncbi:MAG: hypothetical protein RBT63_04690, partial [Bdellovibrionales bacterium]|nr:hypothetical protein [Bdellovibrionales bacterium]